MVTVLGLVGGAPARASRVFQNSVPPFRQNRLGNPPNNVPRSPVGLLAIVYSASLRARAHIDKFERLREGFQTARANRLDLRVTLLVYRENERKRGRP